MLRQLKCTISDVAAAAALGIIALHFEPALAQNTQPPAKPQSSPTKAVGGKSGPADDRSAKPGGSAQKVGAKDGQAYVKAQDDSNRSGGAGTGSSNQPPTRSPDEVAYEEILKAVVNNAAVTVTVRTLDKKCFAVISGTLPSKDELDAVNKRVTDLLENNKTEFASLVIYNALDSGTHLHKDSEVSHLWQCGFIQGDATYNSTARLQDVALALNSLLPPSQNHTPYVTAKDTTLWLQGPLSRVQAIRSVLAMIDAPLPQVRLDVWAIQYAGSQKNVGERMMQLNGEISAGQSCAEKAGLALNFAIRKNATSIKSDPVFKAITGVGFDMEPESSQSLIECLWCIGMCSNRAAILHDASDMLRAQLGSEPEWIRKPLKDDANLFPNLTRLLAPAGDAAAYNSLPVDQLTLTQFAAALRQYIAFVDALGIYGPPLGDNPDQVLLDYPAAPEALTRAGLAVDRQLERLVRAYASDMEQMFFLPLLNQARQWSYGGSGGGVGLAGKTSITVTSRFKADVVPQLQVYGERQVARVLIPGHSTANQQPAASGAAPGASGAAPPTAGAGAAPITGAPGGVPAAAAPLASAAGSAAGLVFPDRAAIDALMQPTADISYYPVAPGITIHVTPTMTPDGATADLTLDAQFGIDTHVGNADTTGGQSFRPPDAVKSHQVTTQANVGGFNLFPISSFNMDTIYPKPPFILPILGNIPVFGSMFRFGRGDARTYHQSVILVNATLVPRSLGLVGFYGANFAGRTALTQKLPATAASRGVGEPSVGKYNHDAPIRYDDFLKGK